MSEWGCQPRDKGLSRKEGSPQRGRAWDSAPAGEDSIHAQCVFRCVVYCRGGGGGQSPNKARREPAQRGIRLFFHREEESAGGEAEWIANRSISQLSKQIKEMGSGFSLSGKGVGTQGEKEKGLQNP